ncbi:Anaphase promoting complex subunit 11 [Porites harrisoni]
MPCLKRDETCWCTEAFISKRSTIFNCESVRLPNARLWSTGKSFGWIGVATWRWVANDENCGICRMAFDGCCPDCKIPGDDCPLVWGRCSHVFHMHCILKWLNSQLHQQLCPMCRQEWQFKE